MDQKLFRCFIKWVNPLSTNPSVFDHFVKLAFKGLISELEISFIANNIFDVILFMLLCFYSCD